MAVKHRRMGRKQGDAALTDLTEDLRETLALIKEEEEFDADTDASPKNTAELERKFPALASQRRMT
jgi:molybdenum-dependent DNA-binding transcriptional regulator ModE